MSRKTWAVVFVSGMLVLLVLVGLMLLGLALSGRMGPGMMSGRGPLQGRGLRGEGGLIGSCPWCGGVMTSAPRWLGGLLLLTLVCSVPLALLVVLALLVRWALGQHCAPPSPPSA
jgi:hypothetical protein